MYSSGGLLSFFEKAKSSFVDDGVVCISYNGDYPHFFLEKLNDYFIKKYSIKEYVKSFNSSFSLFNNIMKKPIKKTQKILFISIDPETKNNLLSYIKNKDRNTLLILAIPEIIAKQYNKELFQNKIHKTNQFTTLKDIPLLRKIYKKTLHEYIDIIFKKYEKLDTNFLFSILYKAKFIKLYQFKKSITEFEKVNISKFSHCLFELSNSLFNRNKNKFYESWNKAKKNISIDLLNSYIKKQLWKSYLYIVSKKKNQNISSSIEGLPYQFKKELYKNHSLDNISRAIELIYRSDILLKKNAIKKISNCEKALFFWFN
jgi:hypothetical protein